MSFLASTTGRIASLSALRFFGKITAISANRVLVAGLSRQASLGDRVTLPNKNGRLYGEIVAISAGDVTILPEGTVDGLSVGAEAELLPRPEIAPSDHWIGRIIDPFGNPLDGRELPQGHTKKAFMNSPPPATTRRRLGKRLRTGLAVFDTLLPLVQGQRIGLFAGSGVGKSTLLADFAKGIEADLVVIALIGERGRELREFVEEVLGPEGMKRAIIVAATSDQPPLIRRRCAWAAMSTAEHFRDQGRHVLFLADSITRFAEAHREIALSAGEAASYRGFPASISNLVMSLAERAGPGPEGCGDITAIFSVLVAGSDMEEPIADILRGVLDGHVILDRNIAERGRFPAIDVLRSVSRSLPQAANPEENRMILRARRMLGLYSESELMIRAGLYASGTDHDLDEAVQIYPALDHFVTQPSEAVSQSFGLLASALTQQPAMQAMLTRP